MFLRQLKSTITLLLVVTSFVFLSIVASALSDQDNSIVSKYASTNPDRDFGFDLGVLNAEEKDRFLQMQEEMRKNLAQYVTKQNPTYNERVLLRSLRIQLTDDQVQSLKRLDPDWQNLDDASLARRMRQNYHVSYVPNQRGHWVPTVVDSAQYAQGRLVVRSKKDPDDTAWKTNDKGQLQLVSCQLGKAVADCNFPRPETPGTCGEDQFLPKGVSWEDLTNDPSFDCRSDRVKKSDYLALACNLYFESRAEGSTGMRSVSEVTLNRARDNILNDKKDPSIREVVFANAQFSWTNGSWDTRVGFDGNQLLRPEQWSGTQSGNRGAWLEALTMAMGMYNFETVNGKKVPLVVDPQLKCHNFYLSLHYYKNLSDLKALGWADDVWTRANSSEVKPVCVGNHIFIKDPNDDCDNKIVSDPERDDKDEAFRNHFYKNCLGVNWQPPTYAPSSPSSSLCTETNLERAVCMQMASMDSTDISGRGPVGCSSIINPASDIELDLGAEESDN